MLVAVPAFASDIRYLPAAVLIEYPAAKGPLHQLPLPAIEHFGCREYAQYGFWHADFILDDVSGKFGQDRGIALQQDGFIRSDVPGPVMQLRIGVFIRAYGLFGGNIIVIFFAETAAAFEILPGAPEIQYLLARLPSGPHVASAHARTHQLAFVIVVIKRYGLAR